MIVRRTNFETVLANFTPAGVYAVDTETTGLRPYQQDRLFSIILADATESYYLNFQEYAGLDATWTLPREWLARLKPIFGNPETLWFMHNAKFDMAMLLREGLEVAGQVHDTEVCARLIESNHLSYTLDLCAKRIGLKKSKIVDDYIDKHKLYTMYIPPGKKTKKKDKHFDKVPFHIISEYGEQDGRITHQLGLWQQAKLAQIDIETPIAYKRRSDVHANDMRLTKVCFDMERAGLQIDVNYSKLAIVHYESIMAEKAKDFFDISGLVFADSTKTLVEAFTRVNEKFPLTAKGNPSFTDDVLAGFSSPLASVVRSYREAAKVTSSYFQNFLYFADHLGRVHANFRISGTETSRFSIADPPLQQLPKEETGPYPVRRAVIPFDFDSCLVMIDYSQMEYRMMVDYARDHALAKLINEGMDVHEATANRVKISRTYAKTVNFLLLYGGGAGKLAGMLNMNLVEAKKLRDKYFSAMPAVKAFIKKVTRVAKDSKRVYNWAGYVTHYPDPDFAYTAPNHLIQGGCAQVVRRAMPQVAEILRGRRSQMILQVHDELIFNAYPEDFHLFDEIQKVMETSYLPDSLVPLTCEMSHSWVSWADKIKGKPSLETCPPRN